MKEASHDAMALPNKAGRVPGWIACKNQTSTSYTTGTNPAQKTHAQLEFGITQQAFHIPLLSSYQG